MTMLRNAAAATAATTAALALAPVLADAALPAKGATYVGTVAGKTVTVKISKKRATSGKYTFDCGSSGGPVGSWIKLKLESDGSFSGKDTAFGGKGTIDALKGKFKSKSSAKATFTVGICDGKGGKVTLVNK